MDSLSLALGTLHATRMLRAVFSPEPTNAPLSAAGHVGLSSQAHPPVASARLLVLHAADKRLKALQDALFELGYDVAGAELHEARSLMDRAGAPDVLVVALDPHEECVVAFGRDCLTAWPALQVVYITWVPWNAPTVLWPGEHVLPAPFTAEDLAASLDPHA
jgi:hypothetical protein